MSKYVTGYERTRKEINYRHAWRKVLTNRSTNVKVSNSLKKCQTPGAVYSFNITDYWVSAAVDLQFSLDLTEEKAARLEDELHDALEAVLKQFFV